METSNFVQLTCFGICIGPESWFETWTLTDIITFQSTHPKKCISAGAC